METTTIIVNLNPHLQTFLRFYYKSTKPFFTFPPESSINAWISDNLIELPNNIPISFKENTFKIEIPLLYGQDTNKRYHVNSTFMVLLKQRVALLLKDYYNQRFEESIANKYNVDLTIINIMNELGLINLATIIEIEGMNNYLDETESFRCVKEFVLKNNRTEFEMIAKKFTRWKSFTRKRKSYQKNRKKTNKKTPPNVR